MKKYQFLIDQAEKNVIHGHARKNSRVPEYNIWQKMKRRCYNPKDKRFNRYGARGIYVCEEWKADYQKFYSDMGPRPSNQHSLDRINNDGPYSRENCRWATWIEQNNNRNQQSTVYLTFNGEKRRFCQVIRELGLNYHVVWGRLKIGWSFERAISTPTRFKKSSAS